MPLPSPLIRVTTLSWRRLAVGLAALMVLLFLVAGVPAALVLFLGWPFPEQMPTPAILSAPIDRAMVAHILAVLVWLAWVHFTVAVIVETTAEITGIRGPIRIPGLAGSQALARHLIAAVLMLTAAVVTMPTGLSRPVKVSLNTMAVSHAASSSSDYCQATSAAAAPPGSPTATREPRKTGLPAATKFYMVRPPHGGSHESLWEIAERHLGSGRRYREIFELNAGRIQPDGNALRLESLIRPGWILHMPDDAVNVDVVHKNPTDETLATPPQPEQVDDIARPVELPEEPGVAGDDPAGKVMDSADRSPARLAAELTVTGLFAAGLMTALDRRRRQRGAGRRVPRLSQQAVTVEKAIRFGADPAAARLVDLGLRHLSATLRTERQLLPEVYAARLRQDSLDLLLAPPCPAAPLPWVAQCDGTRWNLSTTAARDLNVTGTTAPFPGLVTLGTACDERVLVNLEAAQGVIALRGPAEQAQAMLAAVAAELAVNCWSDQMRITLVGFGNGLELLAPDRIQIAGTLDEVLPELEARAMEIQRRMSVTGLDSVLTGRTHSMSSGLWAPHFLLIADPVDPLRALRLTRLAALAPVTGGYLVAGEVAGATWTWEISENGRLRADALDLEVATQLLPSAQYAAIVELFQ